MFSPLKMLKQAVLPKPSFITPSSAGTGPSNNDIWDDSGFDAKPKPRLLTRIYEGLPGFLGGAGFIAATKCTTAALCSTVSAPALLTGAAVLSVGAVASQTLSYIRERKAELHEIAKAESLTGTAAAPSILRNLFNREAIGRELRAFGQEVKSKSFWKGAATKGLIAGGLGATFGYLAHNDTVQAYAHKAVDAIKDSSLVQKLTGPWFAKAPVQNIVSGKVTPLPASAVAASAAAPSATPASAAVASVAPAPAVVAEPPRAPVTLLDKARALFAEKGVNADAAEKMLSRTDVSEAQRIKDAAVGLGNGKYGFETNPEAAKAALKLAAENGNAQAARDLALNGRPLPVAAPSVPAAAPPAPVSVPAADATEVSARAKADAFIRANYPETVAPAAAETVTTPAIDAEPVPPKQVGSEAARCVMEKATSVRSSIRSLCSIFKNMVEPNDHVLMQDASGALSTPYIYDGEAPQETVKFMNNARRDFRDTLFMPSLQASN